MVRQRNNIRTPSSKWKCVIGLQRAHLGQADEPVGVFRGQTRRGIARHSRIGVGPNLLGKQVPDGSRDSCDEIPKS